MPVYHLFLDTLPVSGSDESLDQSEQATEGRTHGQTKQSHQVSNDYWSCLATGRPRLIFLLLT